VMGRCLRGANFKGPSQTRVVPVKEVRAVKLKGTNINFALKALKLNFLMSREETARVARACFLRFKQNDTTE